MSTEQTTSLIVGTSRGIGLELARQLAARGDEVIATCRDTSAALEMLGVEVVAGVDISSDDGVGALEAAVAGRGLDLILVVAGILQHITLNELDIDAIRRQFEVNAIAPLRVVAALSGELSEGSKVALVTSRMGSIEDNSSGSHYGYRMSKAALNMAGKSLAVDLHDRGIAVALLHPGYVRTDMTGGRGLIDAQESAQGLIERIDDLTLESSGGFWHTNGEILPW